MKLSLGLPLISCAAGICMAEATPEPQYIFQNPPASESIHKIPTPYESAVLGRRLLALTTLGTLATVFPHESKDVSGQENRPAGMGGMPHGLMEYVADCEDEGNPTMLAINIETSFKNVRGGSNISLAMQWTPPYLPDKRIKSTWFDRLFGDDDGPKEAVPYSAANLPRFSLLGYIEEIDTASTAAISSCFVKAHPDAKYWLPGNRIHEAQFVRLVVQAPYWIGGFGDRAYIGWISPDDWKNVTKEEWEAVRLPGEKKGWDEWSFLAEL
ncbi:pyridoxamine 5'-phosphate oxidase-domain-containing protein [Pseudomassariella vexata]|uniref:Pyridoxamine 5'-phosphate oxidase-domain-containing protein n=1 Tax=Pseudomassariella vexata TaxID=1141098 RepID=A0A1Y2E731_9PEZI|nr:pyridoxamine 5'-phosphate oxidase-domain-containing protein [Pseudomassariella vexata]ORY67383.1 pyridoxamine 5'-phosphate oxidase-domain-containing protein [Pseudomassariella vexata]